MTNWQWECFEHYIHSGVFHVIDPGPLLSPVRKFKIARNHKLDLVLETLVMGEEQASSSPVHQNGTVRFTTETVEFAGNDDMHCTAYGVLPFSRRAHNAETVQKARVYSLNGRLRNDIAPAYTIDWLGNLDSGPYIWRDSSISEKRETIDTLTLGYGKGAIELSARSPSLSNINSSALELVIAGIRLFLCNCAPEVSKGVERPGYVFYVGNPTDEIRKKIRQVLSFCLGNYLIYLGSTTLCEKSEIISFSAVSPPSIGTVSEIPALPPSPLSTGDASIAEQNVIAHMADAAYAHYDELGFNSFSWAYWHARYAPLHMAAGHFGAAIEALQKAYLKSQSEKIKIERNLVSDKEKWNAIIEPFLQTIAEAGLDPSITDILSRRVKYNLNQKPADKILEAFLAMIGITLGPVESAAWKRRNQAAHGAEMDLDSLIPTIRDTKLLKIIMHRILLKITGASDRYYDDYTIGHAIRNVIEPVP